MDGCLVGRSVGGVVGNGLGGMDGAGDTVGVVVGL